MKSKYRNIDHRILGKDLKLYYTDPILGNGLILWTPRGSLIRKELQCFISEELNKQGYEEIFTPHIGKIQLYEQSGHFPYYQNSQFPPLKHDNQNLKQSYLLRAMNCPMHIKLYESEQRSYKNLPIKFYEFGTVYRWEQSGELNGLTRVRGFTQDDAHIFCNKNQIYQEIENCLLLIEKIFKILGINNYEIRLSLKDDNNNFKEKYIGDINLWNQAEKVLFNILKNLNMKFTIAKGHAAFYGPKLDFIVKDVINRDWQLGTIQIDYNLPQRFDLKYIGKDNNIYRPVIIHRAPFGSLERFLGLIIEHFSGDFPLWLAPEQIRIIPVHKEYVSYAKSILDKLKTNNIRAKIDDNNLNINLKIKKSEKLKIPYIIILGKKELETKSLSIRSRIDNSFKKNQSISIDNFIFKINNIIKQKILPNVI